MAALLLDLAPGHHRDLVGILDGGKPVGHHQGGAALAQLVQGLLDENFRGVVQSGGCLIQNQNGGIFQKYPGNAQPLLLAAGEPHAPLTDHGVVAMLHGHDGLVNVGPLSCLNDLFFRSIQPSVEDVIPDTGVEQVNILLHDADVPPEGFQGEFPDIGAVDGDGAGLRAVEIGDQVADGGLAAAAGAHQGEGAAGGDVQINAVDHFPVGIVAVMDIPEGDMALEPGGFRSLGGVRFRLGVHHLQEPLKAADAALKLLGKADQGVDGIQEQIDGHDEGGVIRKVDLPGVEEQAAGNEDHHIEDLRNKGGGGVELGHGLVLVPAGLHIHAVAALEFFLFLRGVGKGLGDPDAGDGALQRGIDLGDGLAALPEGQGHFVPDFDGNHQQHRHTQENDQGQPEVDGGKIDKGNDHGDGADDEILRAVMGQLADLLEVAGEAAHDLAGLMGVVVAEGELLQVAEKIPAHMGLHPDAHNVTLVLNEEVQPHPHQIDEQHADTGYHDHPVIPVGDQVVEHGPGDHGVDNGRQGHQERSQHIQGKELLMGLVVFQKPFQHEISSLFRN